MKIGVSETVDTIKVFFLMGAAGLVIGLLFDIFRAFRTSFKSAGKTFDRVSLQVTDVIFAVSAFCIFTLCIYIFNSGEIRSYCFLGCAAGIAAYFLALAPVINRLLRLIFKIIYLVISHIIVFFVKIFRKLFMRKILQKRKKTIYEKA